MIDPSFWFAASSNLAGACMKLLLALMLAATIGYAHEGREAGRRPRSCRDDVLSPLNRGRGHTIVTNVISRSPAVAVTFQQPAVGNVSPIV
jgi:hypothetical protein